MNSLMKFNGSILVLILFLPIYTVFNNVDQPLLQTLPLFRCYNGSARITLSGGHSLRVSLEGFSFSAHLPQNSFLDSLLYKMSLSDVIYFQLPTTK